MDDFEQQMRKDLTALLGWIEKSESAAECITNICVWQLQLMVMWDKAKESSNTFEIGCVRTSFGASTMMLKAIAEGLAAGETWSFQRRVACDAFHRDGQHALQLRMKAEG
jgi:hypothetical protein